MFASLVLLMAAAKKPWKIGASSEHTTNLKQSIFDFWYMFLPEFLFCLHFQSLPLWAFFTINQIGLFHGLLCHFLSPCSSDAIRAPDCRIVSQPNRHLQVTILQVMIISVRFLFYRRQATAYKWIFLSANYIYKLHGTICRKFYKFLVYI